MLVSPGRRFIFVHVPKTGGTSLRLALMRYTAGSHLSNHPMTRRMSHWRDRLWWFCHPRLASQHAHVSAIQIRDLLPRQFRMYFSFGVVRNPWDWHVSWYHHVLARKSPRPGNRQAIRDRAEVLRAGSFANYVRTIAVRNGFLQANHLTDEAGRIAVDFVGRIESFDADVRTIFDRLRISKPLRHANATTHRDYREYYDPATRDIIGEISARDCELFGYDFDNGRVGDTVAPELNTAA